MNVYVYLFYYPGSVKLADIRCGDAEKLHWCLMLLRSPFIRSSFCKSTEFSEPLNIFEIPSSFYEIDS